MQLKGQGATEYLVLLAVVLIVALVSVALLGFFPRMASDAQITQSQAYWQSASPIAVVEVGSAYWDNPEQLAGVDIRLRNTGAYAIRLSKVLGGGANSTQYYNYVGPVGYGNWSDVYLAPGQEVCIGREACSRYGFFFASTSSAPSTMFLSGLGATCDSNGYGLAMIKDFGFEYTLNFATLKELPLIFSPNTI